MELERVFELLEIGPRATVADLNTSYRRLAKKYHPDFNRGRESWAHTMMTDLNLAYEAALEHFSFPKAVERASKRARSEREAFRVKFKEAIDRVLKALYTYYQYGLENVHQRGEGVKRFRFRECVSGLKKGVDLLEAMKPEARLPEEVENLRIFTDFAKAFLQNALMDRFYTPSSDSVEAGAYRHFRDGSDSLDYAIKDVFFGDLLIPVRKGSYYQKIAAGYENLLVVLSKYAGSGWVPETVIKIYLLEMLTRVIGFLEKVRH
jgi:hypothetical protein